MSPSKKAGTTLWVLQALLAALFLFAGTMKFVLPPQAMQQGPIVLPLTFIRFIGLCEILGAAGLILPTLLRIRPVLTTVAASGLVIIMIGAVTLTVAGGPVAGAVLPFVVGLLAASVAYGRWRVAPVA